MPVARRSRTLAAPPERVWDVVADPHHLPRWWPRVTRVEAVTDEHFTEVLATEDGRSLRADFRVVGSRAPERRAWEQEVQGTPFETVLAASTTEIKLLPDGDGTRVTLVARQQLRGSARMGGFMVRRATGRVLDDALDALEALHGP
jgi:uncharacterized protein YndB with AHSA1/START domain